MVGFSNLWSCKIGANTERGKPIKKQSGIQALNYGHRIALCSQTSCRVWEEAASYQLWLVRPRTSLMVSAVPSLKKAKLINQCRVIMWSQQDRNSCWGTDFFIQTQLMEVITNCLAMLKVYYQIAHFLMDHFICDTWKNVSKICSDIWKKTTFTYSTHFRISCWL